MYRLQPSTLLIHLQNEDEQVLESGDVSKWRDFVAQNMLIWKMSCWNAFL